MKNCIDGLKIKKIVQNALMEDIGKGDITSQLLILRQKKVKALLRSRGNGIICGIDVARLVFHTVDKNIRFISRVKDGDKITKGQVLAQISGMASNILLGERVAMNFLVLLSGIATRTRKFVDAIAGYNIKIMDTRKTIPGLRELEKYAVKVGGGYNHRFRLDEMILIKENHLISAHGNNYVHCIKNIIKHIKKNKHNNVKLEIEVNNLKEFKEALKANPDIIMLDNMRIADIKKAVIIRNSRQEKRPLLEASGSVRFRNVLAHAKSGVDVLSLGTLTKDIVSLDLSLDIT